MNKTTEALKLAEEVLEYHTRPLCMCFAGCPDCDPKYAPDLNKALAAIRGALAELVKQQEWPYGATVKLRWIGYGPYSAFGWAKRGKSGELVSACSLSPLDPQVWEVVEERAAPVQPVRQEPVAKYCGYCKSMPCACPPLPMPAANAAPVSCATSCPDVKAIRDLAEWEKLKDPATLHLNLLRGFPARLTPEMLIHLLGNDAKAIRAEALEEAAKHLAESGLIGSNDCAAAIRSLK